MRVTRVHSGVPLESGLETELSDAAANHVLKVLRLRIGDPLVLFDGRGADFAAEIVSCVRSHVRVRVLEAQPGVVESPLQVTLVQAVSRTERMDWTIQKATELGVHAIAPVLTTRSLVRLEGAQALRKLEHWRSIVVNACEQCGRSTLPLIHEPQPLSSYLERLSPGARRILLDPSGTHELGATPADDGAIEMLIGPEGGFETAELADARLAGFVAMKLGPRILRTETAGVAALAILQALHGDLR